MMTLSDFAAAIPGAQLLGAGETWIQKVSTDTRALGQGALFFALKGDRFDGHQFIEQAIEGGASGLVVSAQNRHQIPQIIVNETRAALGLAARAWRNRHTLPVIAVAGSNGKTTVTQMLASILSAEYGEFARLATQGNFNNEIGLPLTLFRLAKDHKAAVVELGMNHPGEMAYLADLARPTVAVVNNAQREHQEFMGSIEATAHENGAVISALPAHGHPVFPADDPCAPLWRALSGTRKVYDFGFDSAARVNARCRARGLGQELILRGEEINLTIPLSVSGRHNAHNATAAAAAALAAGLSSRAIHQGLEVFRPVSGRGVVRHTSSGAIVIDDSYNANPDSVLAAIDLLAERPGQKLLILGDMGEVGTNGAQFHEEVGRYAKARGLSHLLALGDLSQVSANAFGTPGGEHFTEIEDLMIRARQLATLGTTLLVKGSRFMRMERVVDAL